MRWWNLIKPKETVELLSIRKQMHDYMVANSPSKRAHLPLWEAAMSRGSRNFGWILPLLDKVSEAMDEGIETVQVKDPENWEEIAKAAKALTKRSI